MVLSDIDATQELQRPLLVVETAGNRARGTHLGDERAANVGAEGQGELHAEHVAEPHSQ